jgi:hypothetical protein
MADKTTRTLNPLHFEDLEPHRFEDLVRQLVYDFRVWRKIEATGRLGADEGIDIRAVEAVGGEREENEEDESESPAMREPSEERIWVIQCKREKEIGPTKARQIVRDAVPGGSDAPYGFILSAACDFSMKSRDAFHEEARKRGVKDSHIWGKAELEDLLFLPKNDHLLFAYFNISLQIRRRSLRTELRSRLAMKRKLITVLGDVREDHHVTVLLRDPREERYPRAEDIPDFATWPRWKYYTFIGHEPPDHLAFVVGEHFAYVDDEGKHWDALLDFNSDRMEPPGDSSVQPVDLAESAKYQRYWSYWYHQVPENNRATLKLLHFIHYDRILAVDEHGDRYNEGIHLLVEFDPEHGPFGPGEWRRVDFGRTYYRRNLQPSNDNRIRFFPDVIPELPPSEMETPAAN